MLNLAPTQRPVPSRLSVALAFSAIYFVWGSTYLAIRYAVETIPPFLMASARFLIAGAVLYLYARWRGDERPTRRHWRTTITIGGLLLLGGNGGVVWAEQHVSSGMTSLMVATVPFAMVLLDWIRPNGKHPGASVIVGLCLGIAGIALLVQPGKADAGRIDPLGALVLVGACFSWATGSIYSRHVDLPRSSIMATAMEMLGGGALLLLAGTVAGQWSPAGGWHVSGRSIASLAYLIVFGSFAGYSAYIWLLQVSTPARVGTYAFVNPVVAVFLGWLLAGEALTTRTLLAAGVILSGVLIISLYRGSSRDADNPRPQPSIDDRAS